jgi:hypothetical protein
VQDQNTHLGTQLRGHGLGDYLEDNVDETNRTEIYDGIIIVILGK